MNGVFGYPYEEAEEWEANRELQRLSSAVLVCADCGCPVDGEPCCRGETIWVECDE
jgi:hypothetical protein